MGTVTEAFDAVLANRPSFLVLTFGHTGAQPTDGFRVGEGPVGHAPQDAKTPGCHIAMCVSILGAFGVSAQFGPLQLYSLHPPVAQP